MSATVDLPGDDVVYDDQGVDRSLIRWMLTLSPSERLRWIESAQELIEGARRVQHPRDPERPQRG